MNEMKNSLFKNIFSKKKDVCNFNSFSLLSAEEKDELLKFLPSVDRQSEDSVKSMFQSDSFASYLTLYKTMLAAGEFDSIDDDYIQYLKGKKQRQHVDSWKVLF